MMSRFSEEEVTRSEIKEELRYSVSTGLVLLGFFAFVAILKLIFRDAARNGKEECGQSRLVAGCGSLRVRLTYPLEKALVESAQPPLARTREG